MQVEALRKSDLLSRGSGERGCRDMLNSDAQEKGSTILAE